MKTLSLFCVLAALSLNSCGKDPTPATATSAQAASPAVQTGVSTATQTSTSVSPGPGTPAPQQPQQPAKPVSPGTPDGAYCPVVELAGHYTPSNVTCDTDGKADKIDATAVPTDYTIASDGGASGTVTLKVGAKSLALVFPRNPDTWLDFQKNGTQCSDGAVKSLSQRCPGVKDSSCYYSISERNGKLTALFYRITGAHTYECSSDLSAARIN